MEKVENFSLDNNVYESIKFHYLEYEYTEPILGEQDTYHLSQCHTLCIISQLLVRDSPGLCIELWYIFTSHCVVIHIITLTVVCTSCKL